MINGIEHDGAWLNTCAIVIGGSDLFQFSVTAAHPSQFLRSWGLAAYWGDDRGEGITSGAYPGGAPGGRWNDPNTPVIASSPPTPPPPGSPTVPAAPGWSCTVAGDPTSRSCAHTFELDVYDRVIDGWAFIHGSAYRKSITILLDLPVPHLPPIPPHIPLPVPGPVPDPFPRVPHLPGPQPGPLPNPQG